MSIEKNMNTRIQHKHDIESNWNKALNFIPKAGEIIVYDPDDNYDYARIKIGDGLTLVNELKFSEVQSDWDMNDENSSAYIKNRPEVASDEEIMEMFIQEDIVPIVTDADGSILTDEHGNILLW